MEDFMATQGMRRSRQRRQRRQRRRKRRRWLKGGKAGRTFAKVVFSCIICQKVDIKWIRTGVTQAVTID
jgi:hypothetical protein